MIESIILIIVCFLFFYGMYKLADADARKIEKKNAERKIALSILELFPTNYYYYIVSNILLKKSNGKTTQIDHVIISNYGIFVIESKSYSGTIIGNQYDAEWKQQINGKTYNIYNPIRQNYGHVKTLQEELSLDIKLFESIIVLSTDVTLNINSTIPVIHATELQKTILGYQDWKLSNDDVKEITKKIIELNIYSPANMKKHIQEINENNENESQKLSNSAQSSWNGK